MSLAGTTPRHFYSRIPFPLPLIASIYIPFFIYLLWMIRLSVFKSDLIQFKVMQGVGIARIVSLWLNNTRFGIEKIFLESFLHIRFGFFPKLLSSSRQSNSTVFQSVFKRPACLQNVASSHPVLICYRVAFARSITEATEQIQAMEVAVFSWVALYHHY